MEDNQLQAIIGLFAGVQTAIVHMAGILDHKGIAPRGETVASYKALADGLPEDVNNRHLITTVLNHIASGIENTSQPESPDVLLRLLQGGKASPTESD